MNVTCVSELLLGVASSQHQSNNEFRFARDAHLLINVSMEHTKVTLIALSNKQNVIKQYVLEVAKEKPKLTLLISSSVNCLALGGSPSSMAYQQSG